MTAHELAYKLLEGEDLEIFSYKLNGSNREYAPILDIQKATIGIPNRDDCPYLEYLQIVSLN